MKSTILKKIIIICCTGLLTQSVFAGNKKNDNKDFFNSISHKANELYNQGPIKVTAENHLVLGAFNLVTHGIVTVWPNSTMSVTLHNAQNELVSDLQFTDGQRFEDSREVITYTGNMFVMEKTENNFPVLKSIIDLTITDYQFTKNAKTMDHLVNVHIVMDVPYGEITLKGLPVTHKH